MASNISKGFFIWSSGLPGTEPESLGRERRFLEIGRFMKRFCQFLCGHCQNARQRTELALFQEAVRIAQKICKPKNFLLTFPHFEKRTFLRDVVKCLKRWTRTLTQRNISYCWKTLIHNHEWTQRVLEAWYSPPPVGKNQPPLQAEQSTSSPAGP